MSAMKKKALNFIDYGIAATLIFTLIGELYRFHGILLLDIWTPFFSAACLIYFLLTKSLKLPDTFWPAAIFVLLGFSSLLLNSGGTEAAFYGIRWASMYFLSVIIYNRPREIHLWLLFVFAALLSVAGFIQLIYVPDFTAFERLGWDPHQNRLLSTWFDPNFVGGFLAFMLPIIIGSGIKNKKVWPLAGIVLIALFLTYSRSAYLALAAGIMVFGIFRSFKIIIFAVVLGVLLLAISPRAQERVGDLIASADSIFTENYNLPDPSARLRLQSWENGWNLYLSAPIFGHGYNAYATASVELKTQNDPKVHSANGSDSSLLTILATTGLAGFVPYILVYLLLARRAFDNRKNPVALGFLAGLTALFVHSIFVNSLLFPLIMAPFWVATVAIYKPKNIA